MLYKNEPNTKLNQILNVKISFCARNVIKNKTKNANKNNPSCLDFVI